MRACGNHLVRGRSSQVRGGGSRREGDPGAPSELQPSVTMRAHTQLSDPPCTRRPSAVSPATPFPQNYLTSMKTEAALVLGPSHQPSG